VQVSVSDIVCNIHLLHPCPSHSEISPDGRSFEDLTSQASLEDFKDYVDVIGPGKGLLAKKEADRYQSTQLTERLHSFGFQVRFKQIGYLFSVHTVLPHELILSCSA
jgi:hypothetical protein